jgi:hypothetical protein
VATHLPQLESVIRPGVSGYLVARDGSRDEMVEALVQRFLDVRDSIEMGTMNAVRIAETIRDFTPGTQLARVYRYHQEIQDARGLAAAAPTY